jgi:hypothetical protein
MYSTVILEYKAIVMINERERESDIIIGHYYVERVTLLLVIIKVIYNHIKLVIGIILILY